MCVVLSNWFPKFVQKELDNADDHRKELENLSILNHLKHPNIVELLSSYTYQNKHSLLFPRAQHGTLATLLQTNRLDTDFQSDTSLLVALAGLTSAIEHVHDFFEHRIDLKLIGCHHDLRPHNILVSGTTFILADFGLSRFKESTRDSDTPFQRGMGDYLAPECEDHETFEPRRIRRSSDIWSFGCILVEVATYMVRGHTAVETFRNKRLSIVRAFVFYLFHNGPNKPSSVVADWLLELEQSAHISCTLLVILARSMLSVNPLERPKAKELTSRIRFIVMSDIAAIVSELFDQAIAQTDSLDIVIERSRFMSWKYAIGILDLEKEPNTLWAPEYSVNIQYDSNLDYLKRIREYLKWRLRQEADVWLSFTELRSLNDRLSELLAPKQQERSRNYFRISITNTDDERIAKQIESSGQGVALDREIRLSTALKHMATLMLDEHDRDTNSRQMDPSKIRNIKEFGNHSIGQLESEGQIHRVLIEWRRYEEYSADIATSREGFTRLNAIVKQMSTEKPVSMRTLRCTGYYLNESRYAFGILYEIPPSVDPRFGPVQYPTLHQLIAETSSKEKLWPVLDDRFKLAYTLAKSILDFHLCGWLHRNLNASNVTFLPLRGSLQEEHINNPYIIGFNHSRPDDPNEHTSGITRPGVKGYQHPRYRGETGRYRPQYDYYSLGIILMEIGHWRTFHQLVGFKYKDTYCEGHDRKLKARIPQLRQLMGRDYCEAVMACISEDFVPSKAENGTESNTSVYFDFENKVLSRLDTHLV